MFFTLFEVAAVFFEEYPGTEIPVSKSAVWAILIFVGSDVGDSNFKEFDITP